MRLNVDDHRRAARRALPRLVFDYLEGAAEDERCMRRNADDLARLHLLPRCLRDTQRIDLSIEVFGRRWAAPLGIAPVGFTGLMRPRGDVLVAEAAAEAGVPHVLSTASNARLEAVRQAGAEQWLQLYVMTDRAMAEQLVRRAQQAGYGALVLTVDVPVSGYRERDVRNGFKLPFRPTLRTVVDMALHPRWVAGVLRHGSPSFVNLSEHEDAAASAQSQAALLARAMDRSLVWSHLDWLRRIWKGPLIVKGLLHPEDARLAVRHGVDGVIVSNHGGRQLDAAPSTISVLPAVVDAVGGAMPVFVDSGFRRGSDIAKALALGAKAVFIGRPAIYGLAGGGRAGVGQVLQTFKDELERTYTLIGAACAADLQRDQLLPGATHG